MNQTSEQRTEQRLKYDWPIRFAAGAGGVLSMGKMVDISSFGGAFTCESTSNCPKIGQHITTMFSVPRFGRTGRYDMANYSRIGRVCRVEATDENLRRVAIQFTEPLFFKPGHQDVSFDAVEEQLSLPG